MKRLLLTLIILLAILPAFVVSAQEFTNDALKPCTPGKEKIEGAGMPEMLDSPGETSLFVVTTVSPITNLVFNIAGNRIKIHGLVPEGVNSHTFEPRPSDAAILAQADLIFVNGLNLELPTMKLAEANLKEGAAIIELGKMAITEADWKFDFSFPQDEGNPNPHLWINPLLAERYAETIRETLSAKDPEGAAYYQSNFYLLSGRLRILDQAICDVVATIPEGQRKLLTYHDSYAYFAPRYGMTVIGAIQPADFSEPSAREVAALIDQIRSEQIPAIFGSEVFASTILEQIGKETGVRYVDTLADDDLPNQDNRLYHSYLQLMVNNVTTIAEALGGDPSKLKNLDTSNIPGADDAVASASE